MPTYPLQQSASSVMAGGTATVTLGPLLARERWQVNYTVVTGLSMTITVALSDGTVADTTLNDPRPTVTDNTVFDLPAGKFIRVTWAKGNSTVADGTPVTATVMGTKGLGSAV